MAVNDLTGQQIQNTYQRVIQTDGTLIADGTGSELPIKFEGPNLIVSGAIKAQSYIVSQSLIHVSSGSTNFGNSADDVHTFTGSLTASGDIRSAGNISSSNFHLPIIGKISSPSAAQDTSIQFNNTQLIFKSNTEQMRMTSGIGVVFNGSNNAFNDFRVDGSNDYLIFGDAGENKVAIGTATFGGALLTVAGDITATNITASGHIKAIGGITASSIAGLDSTTTGLHVDGFISSSHITSSGAISASGVISASGLYIHGNLSASGDTLTATKIGAFQSSGPIDFNNQNMTNVDIDSGTIDGATIATSDVTVGSGKTLDVSGGTLTLAANQISGDEVEGGTIAATTITTLGTAAINATANIDIGAYSLTAQTLISDLADGGAAPMTITSTTVVPNLNADKLDGADLIDEDTMGSNSATAIPTQQSVKAYVDNSTEGISLDGSSGYAVGGNFIVAGVPSDSQPIVLTAQSVYIGNPEAQEIFFGNANYGFDSDTINSATVTDASPESVELAGNLAHSGIIVPFDIKDIEIRAYYRPAQDSGNSSPFASHTAGANINEGEAMTFTARIYESNRLDSNNSDLTLTQRGTASDVLSAGAQQDNKFFYICDTSSPISSPISAGNLLFVGFEFTCEDLAINFPGHVKITYTLFAKRA